VLGGDGRAFGVVFDRHRDRVFRHIRWLIKDPIDAEDLTAATFLELWRRRDVARMVDDSLLPWLLVTAANMSRNSARAHRRYGRLLAKLPPPEGAVDEIARLDEKLDSEWRSRILIDALSVLSETDQSLFALVSIEGMSIEQASLVLGISYGAAKTRLSRARRRLNSRIGGVLLNSYGGTT
jgi:RNA polymerase sigma-70 factor (ECF subfamily)